MFNNKKSGHWLDQKSKSEVEKPIKITRYNKHAGIKK